MALLIRFIHSFRPYISKDILAITLLGFASGLPILMTLSTLTYWLSVYGVEKGSIGLMSLTGMPYVFKFLWAPFLDHWRLPILGKLGRRKGWIIFFQTMIVLVFLGLSMINPKDNIGLVALLVFLLAFASASQDIVIDAFRIDYLSSAQQAYGSSATQMSYRIAMLLMGAGIIFASDYLPWSLIFQGVALIMLGVIVVTMSVKEPEQINVSLSSAQNPLMDKIINPFVNFLSRPYALLILGFILAFKLPDAIAGVMVTNFYTEMHYSGTQIAAVSKLYGLVATLLGTLLTASFVRLLGFYRALIVAGVLMGLTNLSYLLIYYDPTITSLMLAISVENFIGGFSSALFVMFLSLLCNRSYSATQYALLSALASFGVRAIGGGSGFLAASSGWPLFFMITAFLFVPGLILLHFIQDEVKKLQN